MFNPLITDFMIVVKRGQAGSFGDLDLTFELVEY
jgi:hypothetical protein